MKLSNINSKIALKMSLILTKEGKIITFRNVNTFIRSSFACQQKVCFGIRNVHCYYIIMGKVCAIPNLPVYVVSCVISCKGNDNKPNTKGK